MQQFTSFGEHQNPFSSTPLVRFLTGEGVDCAVDDVELFVGGRVGLV